MVVSSCCKHESHSQPEFLHDCVSELGRRLSTSAPVITKNQVRRLSWPRGGAAGGAVNIESQAWSEDRCIQSRIWLRHLGALDAISKGSSCLNWCTSRIIQSWKRQFLEGMSTNTLNFANAASHDWCLYVERLPGRVNAEQTAKLIGCQPHDIGPLVRAKLLRPLGGGPRNSVKYFSSAKLLVACADDRWLDKVTKTISQSRKKPVQGASGQATEVEDEPAPDP